MLAVCEGLVPATAADKLVIKGSNTFGEELGPRLIAEFRKSHPDVSVELESKGTASGFTALLDGQCDIASASRPASEDEVRRAHSRGIRMRSHTIGYYGVAVVVNEKNPIETLSDSQMRSVFTGAINKWKALGWENDQLVQTYIRDPVSGTYLGFQELAMERMPYVRTAKPLKSYREIADAVKADPHGIGYVSMNLTDEKGLRVLAVNGILPTVESVYEQNYPYARQLQLYTNSNQESPAAVEFIRFVQSKQGQQILSDMGYVRRFERAHTPVPDL
jgi:phosphate transport system substrate-binding protein